MMNDKQESVLSLIAALFVLHSAMLAPPISAAMAICLFVLFAIYKFWLSRQVSD